MVKFLGFESFHDFSTSIVTNKANLLLVFSGIFGATFQTHFWADPQQISFLLILLVFDLITGIGKAIKNRDFKSSKVPRWAGITFSYCFLLFISFNLAKYNPVIFNWLPSSLYAIFCLTIFVSLVENINALGWLNISVYNWLKSKLDIDKIMKPEEKSKTLDQDKKSI